MALTVTDLHRSADWYCNNLGFDAALRYRNPVVGAEFQLLAHAGLGDMIVSLVRHDDVGQDRFRESRVGLDHLAFTIESDSELTAWQHRLEDAGIRCNRTNLPEMSIIVFRDPDDIQIELCTPLEEINESSVAADGTLMVEST